MILTQRAVMIPTIKARMKAYNFWRDAVIIGLLVLIVLCLTSMIFPAPYNARYIFNRIFFNPTFQCEDGVYSFAKTRQGACSGHGGVSRGLKR